MTLTGTFDSRPLKAPYPTFGGKSKACKLVWSRLGDVPNFIDAFCRSAAMLWGRPTPPRIETVNDIDPYISNFWRAIKHEPERVACWADDPVNEIDVHARHRWLVGVQELEPEIPDEFSTEPFRRVFLAGWKRGEPSHAAAFRERMRRDPEYYDCKIAGWWVWGCCCWIGAGWCTHPDWQQLPRLSDPGNAVTTPICQRMHAPIVGQHQKRPDISDRPGSRGIHADCRKKRPRLSGNAGTGVHSPDSDSLESETPASDPLDSQHRPQLGDQYSRGRGVHGNDAAGTCEQRRAWLIDWFQRLADRLRVVRVCCGDWLRVCDSHSVTTRLGLTGVFLDPPYRIKLKDGTINRDGDLYGSDQNQDVDKLVDHVIAYCIERGPDPLMRIAVCGLTGEGYEALEPLGWECVAWRSGGGYGNRNKANNNRERERIWFSPHCLKPEEMTTQRELFA
jgi:hypothetical protein